MLALCAAVLPAQSVRIYSEFTRVDPFGKVVPADRSPKGLEPREILSPALVRNGHTSFHIVVNAPAGEEFSLFVVQNPAGALQLNLYKENYEKRGNGWIPDLIKPVSLHYSGRIPDPASLVENQTHMSYLLDVFVPPKAAVRRYRVEAQLLIQGRFIISPMEVRIVPPVPKDAGPAIGALPGIDAGADAAAAAVLQAQICGAAEAAQPANGAGGLTVRSIIRRNARQDIAIARALRSERDRDVVAALLGLEENRQPWCAQPRMPSRERGAEWYLRFRDHLYRVAGQAASEPVDAPPELKVPPAPASPAQQSAGHN